MNIVVFSGAGLSKESGIPTFRDSVTGLWENHRFEDVASPEGWARDRNMVLRFYQQRTERIQAVQPNAAHRALAKLEEKHRVIHITQNIDDLLERAGCTNILHLHGDILHRKCERHSSCAPDNCDYLVTQTEAVRDGERCPKCGGHMRPHVVWFGEAVDMSPVDALPAATDVFIVVGTSAQVYPAASLLWTFEECVEKYFIDPSPASLPRYRCHRGTACEWIPVIVAELLKK